MFEQMVDQATIETDDLPVVTLTITNKHDRVLMVTCISMHESQVRQYDLATHECVFKESYGGEKTSFIKLKECSQNATGDKFACPYFDDGNFKLRVFGEK